MHKMFVDMHSSSQIREGYAKHLMDHSQKLPSKSHVDGRDGSLLILRLVQLSVRLATYVVWPLPTTGDPRDLSARLLPPELEAIARSYGQFYRQHWPNRQLHWLHYLSRVTLTYVTGRGKRCDLITSVPQANLLLRFRGDTTRHDVQQLCLVAKLTWPELKEIATPLVGAGLLRWEGCSVGAPEGSAEAQLVLEQDWEPAGSASSLTLCPASLGVRPEASSSMLGYPQARRRSECAEGTGSAELSESRKYYLQCVIIKVLKANNELSPARLAQLVAELASRPGPMSLVPTPQHLQSMLEVLMEKQYVEYDDRRDLYMYMA